jgi:hypothetical protein
LPRLGQPVYQVLDLALVLPPVVVFLVPTATVEMVGEPVRRSFDQRLGEDDDGLLLVLDLAGVDGTLLTAALPQDAFPLAYREAGELARFRQLTNHRPQPRLALHATCCGE